ncbi:MAG: DUF2807 domain-containing protein [Bacteroidales bacterium]|nr:DUF2807 domain-containing protein [Bacteroidales bacterium]
MKKISLLLIVSMFLFVACEQDYELVTMKYPLAGNYSKLVVGGAFDVTVCDTVTSVVVTSEMQKYVVVRLEEGVLKIKYRPNLSLRNRSAKVLLPFNESLCDVELSGASSFVGDLKGDEVEVELSGSSDFKGTLQGRKIDIDLSGSSDFEGTLLGSQIDFDLSGSSDVMGTVEADNMAVEASGSSCITLTGSCLERMEIEFAGSTDFISPELECKEVTGTMTGSSDAEFSVCSLLSIKLSGSSGIIYGVPAGCSPTVNCSTSGSSSVRTR